MGKKYCETAEKYSIRFTCPYDSLDCDACELFKGRSTPPETFVLLPDNQGETKHDEMTHEQNHSIGYLIRLGGDFKKTSNNAFAMEAFIVALNAGIYPPMWALDALSKVFYKYLNGNQGIDTLFGAGQGKNLRKEMKAYLERHSVRRRIEKYYADGDPIKPNKRGDDAVTKVAEEDDAEVTTYEGYLRERTPEEKLDHAYNKFRRKKM